MKVPGHQKIAGVTGTFMQGQTLASVVGGRVDRSRDLIQCSECGERWRAEMLDECVACGLGGDVGVGDDCDGSSGICPACVRTHVCRVAYGG